MGAWSDDIFGNDLSCDVRDEYRSRMDAGVDEETAVRDVKRVFAASLRDSAEKWTVWIALAAAQIEKGVVTHEVREKALKGIVLCEDPNRDPDSTPFNTKAVATFRKKLGGPAHESSKQSKPKVAPGEMGQVFAVRFPNSDGEAVIIACGPSAHDRPAHYGRVVLLLDLAVEDVTPVSIRRALSDWRPHRQVWHDGLGGPVIGCYDVSGKLPVRKTRQLLSGVALPDAFKRLMRMLAETYRSADLPYIIEHDVARWNRDKWAIDPNAVGNIDET